MNDVREIKPTPVHHIAIGFFSILGGLALFLMIFTTANQTAIKKTSTRTNAAEINTKHTSQVRARNNFGNMALFEKESYISVNNSLAYTPQRGFTAEAWIKPITPPINGPITSYGIISKHGYSQQSFYLQMSIQPRPSTNNYYVNYYFAVANTTNGCSNQTFLSSRTLTAEEIGTWQHIAGVVQNDGKLDLYVNGIREEKNPAVFIGGICMSNTPIIVGSLVINGGVFQPFQGNMDEVRISNTARYQNNFIPSLSPFTSDQYSALLYHLDNDPRSMSPINIVKDSSENERHGDISGSIKFLPSTVK